MRRAELDDIKRRLQERHTKAAPNIRTLKIRNLPGFGDLQLTPESGFLTFCGGTGSGKSALLEAIFCALGARLDGAAPSTSQRLIGGSVAVSVEHSEGTYVADVDLTGLSGSDEEGYDRGAHLVTLAERTYELQKRYFSGDIEVLKADIDAFELEQEFIKLASYINRKSYSKILIWEVDAEGDKSLPYFQITDTDGLTYESPEMSTGELSVLYIAWVIRSSAPYSLILIDEPEAFLPPATHEAVFAMLARYAEAKRLGLIITTHSAVLTELAPSQTLYPIRKTNNTHQIVSGKSAARALTVLGLTPSKSCMLFVEDALIQEVVTDVIATYDLHTVCNFEIARLQGDGSVRNALKSVPQNSSRIAFAGVLDGDMKQAASKWEVANRLAFLPFARAPEAEMIALAEQYPKRMAKALGRTATQVENTLGASKGFDPHERFAAAAADLHFTIPELTRHAWQFWIKAAGLSKGKALARRLALLATVDLP